jgi:hypothetical protein
MAIKNLRWELETTFTRKQVAAMAVLADAVVNIEESLTKELPSMFKEFDWTSVREVMALFEKLMNEDTLGCKAIDDMNAGKVHLRCGNAVQERPFGVSVGDKVKCVNPNGTMLNYGSVHVVDDVCPTGIRLDGLSEQGWIKLDRFVRVES